MIAGAIYLAAANRGMFSSPAVAEARNAKGYHRSCLRTREVKTSGNYGRIANRLKVISAASPFQTGFMRRFKALTKLDLSTLLFLHIGIKRQKL